MDLFVADAEIGTKRPQWEHGDKPRDLFAATDAEKDAKSQQKFEEKLRVLFLL